MTAHKLLWEDAFSIKLSDKKQRKSPFCLLWGALILSRLALVGSGRELPWELSWWRAELQEEIKHITIMPRYVQSLGQCIQHRRYL